MKDEQLKHIIEAALLAAEAPVSVKDLLRLFPRGERPDRKLVVAALGQLGEDYDGRGIELREVASGFRIQVRPEMGEWLGRLNERKPPRYSRALLETLALVAYRQPITRAEIEEIRGVSVSSNIVRVLLDREWVRVVGHRDVPGRPAMLGTTREFLDYFNLKSLDEMPSLAELTDFDALNAELNFDLPVEGVDDAVGEDGTPTNDSDDDDFDLLGEDSSESEQVAPEPDELAARNEADADNDSADDDGAEADETSLRAPAALES